MTILLFQQTCIDWTLTLSELIELTPELFSLAGESTPSRLIPDLTNSPIL